MIAFEIPGDPVAFARTRTNASGHRFTPKPQAGYGSVVRVIASARMKSDPLLEGPLRLTVRAEFLYPLSWPQKKRDAIRWKTSKPDADNLLKIIADGMSGIVYRDDAQIVEACVQKVYSSIRSGVTVTVERFCE